MNAKQCKRARSVAFREAKRRGLWKKGEAQVYGKWWRRLLAKFFPKFRKKYGDWVGRWYKRVVKDWAKQVAASVHDKDWQALQKAREKMDRQRARELRIKANA